MKWIKKGKIFDPTNHGLEFQCTQYAQSPQVIVFEDYIRVYFSTRYQDKVGSFISKVVFIDFNKQFTKILNHSKKEVIKLGNLGCFDEHGIFPFSPLKDSNRILAYTCGWSRRKSVPVETSTGLAISEDNGETYRKIGEGPIFTSSLYEPMLVGDSFVRKYNGIYHMWYIFAEKWLKASGAEPPARVYKIAYTSSLDGLKWSRQNGKAIISDVLNSNECQALPTVIKKGERYHMFFCYREATDFRKNSNRGYKLGYAYSKNLYDWTRDDSKGIDLSLAGWDSEMMCYPHLFEVEGKIYLLYNGNDFGKFGFGLGELVD